MGFYTFMCRECKEKIEVEMKPSEYKHLEQCPLCKSMDIERIWGVIPTIWKTSGAFGKSTSNNSE